MIRLLLLVELVVVSSRDLLVVGEGGSNSFRGAVGSNTGKAGGWVVIDREDVEEKLEVESEAVTVPAGGAAVIVLISGGAVTVMGGVVGASMGAAMGCSGA